MKILNSSSPNCVFGHRYIIYFKRSIHENIGFKEMLKSCKISDVEKNSRLVKLPT